MIPDSLWASGDKPFRLSLALGRISNEGHDKKSTPERRWNAIARGPRRNVKGHDRLMAIVPQPADTPPPPTHNTPSGGAA